MEFIFKHLSKIFIAGVILVVLVWISMAIVAVKGIPLVRDKGLKTVVEGIWYGQSK